MLLVLLHRENGISLLSTIRSFSLSLGLDGSVFPSKLSRISAPAENLLTDFQHISKTYNYKEYT